MSDRPVDTQTPPDTAPTVHGPDGGTANGVDNAAQYAPRVPAAVRRAARRAEELQQQMAAEAAGEPAPGGEPPGPAELPREDQTPLQQPQDAPQSPSGDDWHNRYRTLQGKYDHEIPQLRMHIQHLESLIATMQSAPAQPPVQPSPEVEIPEEDYTTYGPDFVESTRRWARAEVQQDLQRQQRQIDELRNRDAQFSGDRTKDKVRAELNRDPEIGPYWEQMDGDPAFNAWLADFDPFSGRPRLEMLREAYVGGDAVRTGRFFKAFLHEHTDLSRAPAVPPAQTPYSVTPAPQGYYGNGAGPVDLSAYAAPGRASSATPGPGAPDRRIWTNRDIQAFYEGRLKGRYKGREAEADRLERDILAAAQEGRVSQ